MNFGIITLILVIVTVLISLSAFKDAALTNKLILWPRKMDQAKEYYRLLSSGFIHADGTHLFFNMFTLFFIGSSVEQYFTMLNSKMLYPLLYLLGIVVASLPSFLKHRHNSYFRSLGASGGVSAILFSMVYFAPWAEIYIFFIKVPIIIFAVLYLGYSIYMSKKGGDYINHDAHFWGAIFGFIFTLIISPDHGSYFMHQILNPSWSL